MDDLSKLIAWMFKGIVGTKETEEDTPDPLELQRRIEALEGQNPLQGVGAEPRQDIAAQ